MEKRARKEDEFCLYIITLRRNEGKFSSISADNSTRTDDCALEKFDDISTNQIKRGNGLTTNDIPTFLINYRVDEFIFL